MSNDPKRILIVYYNPDPLEKTRMTLLHHLRALEYSDAGHDIVYHNVSDVYARFVARNNKEGCPCPEFAPNEFDAVILHYSFLSLRTIGWPFRKLKGEFNWIQDLDCLKIAIPQDEGDYAGLLDEWLFELSVSVIFSVHYTPDRPLYPIMRDQAEIYPCLPGYIDEDTASRYREKLLPAAQRPYDIVYRARRLPLWFGSAGLAKGRISDVVGPRAEAAGLNVSISTKEEDTIPGGAWLDFIASGKAVLGTQGGYSVIDWRGEVKAGIRELLKNDPSMTLDDLKEKMPTGWDDHRLFTVTPRHFEAIVTKTCQVLLKGHYKGVLVPEKHFIPLEPDWSNLDHVLEKLKDCGYVQDMTDRTYDEILLSGRYSYKAFAQEVEKVLENHYTPDKKKARVHSREDTAYRAIAVMERQLIAQRQEFAVLEAQLGDIQEQTLERALFNVLNRPKLKKMLLLGILLAVLTNILLVVFLGL